MSRLTEQVDARCDEREIEGGRILDKELLLGAKRPETVLSESHPPSKKKRKATRLDVGRRCREPPTSSNSRKLSTVFMIVSWTSRRGTQDVTETERLVLGRTFFEEDGLEKAVLGALAWGGLGMALFFKGVQVLFLDLFC